jgi:hypothetical protein
MMHSYYGWTTAFADTGALLWSAAYSHPPNLGGDRLNIPTYCGWSEAHGHQYTSTPVDLDAMLSSACATG